MTTTLKNPISCGELFPWGVRKRIEWKRPKQEHEKVMENKFTICVDRLDAAGIILCSPQEPCARIPCSPREQSHQTQATLNKEVTLPFNNILHSLPPTTPTESVTRSKQPMSHIMRTRNKNNTQGRNTMQDNKPLNMETFVWPKLSITLSLREKEEDFLAIKGLNSPVRPKKRLKCIQSAIHDVSPGFWLSKVSQERYEVRENKSTRKRPTGLKAMQGVGSDLE